MPPKKKAANGYKFAEPLPKGIIFEDLLKHKWRLGPSIGKGGFGEIYSAQEENSKSGVYPYVIKIEPHANGPLFVETHFYIKHAKAAEIENFKKEKGLKTLGMPVYYGSGSIEYKGEKYRFLVMDKFSTDLYKLYIDNNKVFPIDTVFKLGIQILDVLEYIHQRGYVHADIKAANILLGGTKETQNQQVYLVDFGLATKYTTNNEFKPNPKKAHDGTIELLSRDAHQGVPTRRGDLEILAYNLIQWLGCQLPWEGNLSDPKIVQHSKEENMATVSKMIKTCFGSKTSPKAITEFLNYIKTLKFNTEPDYKKIRNIFTSGVKEGDGSVGTPLLFSESRTPLKRNHSPRTNSRSKKIKVNKDEKTSELSNDEDKTPKPKSRGRPKRDIAVAREDSVKVAAYSTETASSNDEPVNSFITRRKPKRRINGDNSRSLEDLSNDIAMEDYNKESIVKQLTTDERKLCLRTRTRNVKSNKGEENGAVSSDEEETPKPKKGRSKKYLGVIKRNNAMVTADRNEVSGIVRRGNKPKSPTASIKTRPYRISRSLDDLTNACNVEGYTDAMKEIILRKQKAGGSKSRTNSKKKESSPNYHNDDMAGFTEEMKSIALKKKSKEPARKKPTPAVAIATTSKASNKRGLVKPNSKRLQRKLPLTHGEVLSFSDASVSD